ncbi:SIR2 family protein [Promethearchaeum syntrophicum]|uniref:SIR2 family protein n=1 Tax=Promethearchaeum syntrophicum TaxID=2594042 RepID=A0A5B9DC99_9ARCH|nr:SIR2 family protein [Candidatus Prometheoarchaeum syntrophicum]QEE16380.1 hypothetical protein DSAG12_02210 [Candidatus Prometheoarchaeum syntrophicum]
MAIEINKTPKPLTEILSELHGEGFIIYAGAGISIPAPTCAPSWWTLTEEILSAFFKRVPDEYGLPGDMIIKSEIWQPEIIFESFAKLFDEYLYKVFPVLDVAQSNGNHRIIAQLAKLGVLKAVFTTNFDIYIEKALRDEGVEFEVIIDNDQYDELYNQLSSQGFGSKFLLCKIHGTTERPDTIVSVASAYKSSKGFSPPKSQVLQWLMKRYPTLFLGYSGWDFEHNNYRKFWDRTGPTLKHIYWNRRPGETGGPNFDTIFSSCKNKFDFCESDLPSGWLNALKQNVSLGFEEIENQISTIEDLSNQIKDKRQEFLNNWAMAISEASTLAAVITEGIHFSAAFRTKLEQTKQQQAAQVQVSPEKMAELQRKNQEVTAKLQNPSLTADERATIMQEMFYTQMEMQLSYIKPEEKEMIKHLFIENRYPGITDSQIYRPQFLGKITPCLGRFSAAEAIDIALDFINRDIETQKKQAEMQAAGKSTQEAFEFAQAEMDVNRAIFGIMQPEEEKWKPAYDEMLISKEKFFAKEIDRAAFMAELAGICEKAVKKDMGLEIPVMDLLSKLVQNTASAPTPEEFNERCQALFLAVTMAAANFNSHLMKTAESNALVKAMMGGVTNAPSVPDPAMIQQSQQAMAAKAKELMALMQSGEIDGTEYGKRMQIFVAENQKRFQPKPIEGKGSDGRVLVPLEILSAYDNKIRELFGPAFDAEARFEGDKISHAEILLEMCVLSLWLTIAQAGDAESGQKFQVLMARGDFPITSGNASVISFLMEKNKNWIEKAMNELPARFGQQLCTNLVTVSKLTDDIELCKRATLKSLEYTDGKINESNAYEVPYTLAQFYENRGDEINALKYWNLALDGVRTSVPPAFTDVILYHTAKLTAKNGDKQVALKMIGKLHPNYLGNEPPFKTPARDMSLQLAQNLAQELGYSTVESALQALLEQ